MGRGARAASPEGLVHLNRPGENERTQGLRPGFRTRHRGRKVRDVPLQQNEGLAAGRAFEMN